VDLEVKWVYEAAMAKPAEGSGLMNRVSELQRSRLKLDELGLQLEAFWKLLRRMRAIEIRTYCRLRTYTGPRGIRRGSCGF